MSKLLIGLFFMASAASAQTPTDVPPLVAAARSVMAVAYGTNDVLSLPVVDKETPDIEGITADRLPGQWIKHLFNIVDRDAVCRTHPYYQGRTCPKKPLIYNYGGKAGVLDDLNLDLSRRAGSGTSVMGIDCSGFVFASLAQAGLKLKSTKTLKAGQTDDYAAQNYFDYDKNGLNCFEEAPFGKDATLQAGDLLVSPFHIAIVDSVGVDPLGFAQRHSHWSCGNIGFEDMDFTLIQSAPNLNGVGISRAKGADYVEDNFFFRGLLDIAISGCDNAVSGKAAPESTLFMKILRHKETPDCRQTPLTVWNGNRPHH